MLVCAAVGVLLLVVGSRALPRPGAVAHPGSPAVAASAAGPVAVPADVASSAGSTASTASRGSTASTASVPAADVTSAVALVPDAGPGTYVTSSVAVPTTARTGRLVRFDVHVEQGLDLDADEAGRALERTLDDPRSWRWSGGVRFSLVPARDRADLHAYLVTPGTTDTLCYPLLTRGEVSCQAGSKVVLNAKRWVFGADAYGSDAADLARYREYLVNHEFGHALGHHHVGCPSPGRPSPVMLQQTKGLQGCAANPWPALTRG